MVDESTKKSIAGVINALNGIDIRGVENMRVILGCVVVLNGIINTPETNSETKIENFPSGEN